jgi:2'-5' RNA ligase
VRLFLAIDPSPEAVDDLFQLTGRLRTVTRAVRPEQWHVTLAFLGEVAESGLPAVEGAVAEAVATAEPGTLRLGGGGRFGTSVLWAGVRGDLDLLKALAESLRTELGAAGIGYDDRPYRPHLTLARPGPGTTTAQLRADLELLGRYRGPYWPLDRLYLACSHFPAEQRHEKLASWPLLPAEPPASNGRRTR